MKTEFCRSNAFFAAVIGAALLAGCSSQDEVIVAKDESVEEVSERAAKLGLKPSPGRWESTVQIKSINLPGVPNEYKGRMKAEMGKAQTSATCLTPEEAEKAKGELFMPGKESGCTYNKFVMGGGRIDADMTCEAGGMAQNMKMAGTYSEDAYAMDMKAEGNMGGKPMSMEMSVKAKHVGPCDGSEIS